MAWIVEKKRPDRYNVIVVVFCVIGICLATFSDSISLSMGDGLTLLSALFFVLHIVSVAKFGKGLDSSLITILQFGFAAVFSTVVALVFERPIEAEWSVGACGEILYLSTVCTALALLLQNVGQKHTSSSSASLISGLESVFGVFFGIVFTGETVSFKMLIGFVFIFTVILVSELKPGAAMSGTADVFKKIKNWICGEKIEKSIDRISQLD